MASGDRWHRWLLEVRHGGDAAYRERLLSEFLYPWRDEVLGRAAITPGGTLLDVGTGDGLVGFGALDRVGPGGHVIFSDISQDLLDHCREAAAAEGVLGRCSFVLAGADSLEGVADESVDAVTTRSVLIYVKDKAAALREFYRVLRPAGRVSLFEPVNRLHVVPGRFDGYDIGPVGALAARVQAFYDGIQPPDSDPMLDFDDRDLVRFAEVAGFAEVHLDLRVDVEDTVEPCPWDRFVRRSGNPLVPPFGEVLDRVLDPAEAAAFTAHLRPLVESGSGQLRRAVAYLGAVKGPARAG
ncbi:MAG: class I SAM-dependent methyltransferase [Pseudonocardiaceae bacterium]